MTDHQIITEAGYYSFAERGSMKEPAKSGLYEVTHKEIEEMKQWRGEELRKNAKNESNWELALKFIKDGSDDDFVIKYTGLRKASVEKMRRELGVKQGVFPLGMNEGIG